MTHEEWTSIEPLVREKVRAKQALDKMGSALMGGDEKQREDFAVNFERAQIEFDIANYRVSHAMSLISAPPTDEG